MTSSYEGHQRWYDMDPALSNAMSQLREAPDRYQAQVALNMIKIIVEHQMEADTNLPANDGDIRHIVESTMAQKNPSLNRRWYDIHETLASALKLLNDCPDDLQQRIIPTIATMIESSLNDLPV